MPVIEENNILYSYSIEHLFDECRRMELLLQIAVKKAVRENNNSNGNIHGLFVNDEDVEGILSKTQEKVTEEFISQIESLRERYLQFSNEVNEKKDNSLKGLLQSEWVILRHFISPVTCT